MVIPQLLLPFEIPSGLEEAGGKGANLSRLARAGFSVPHGVILTAQAYRAFVNSNDLERIISAELAALYDSPVPAYNSISRRIRGAFARARMPGEIASSLRAVYSRLIREQGGQAALAVRSSATAEDLPDFSFAGQQDTYLNIKGEEALLEAVVRCWSSLWTARAIAYREQNGIAHKSTALAVVVQVMVPSDVSGVMFTANPLSGALDETVIDASFGLGEALVSGQLEPDQYLVDSQTGEVRENRLGAKQVVTRAKPDGGVETVDNPNTAQPSLSEAQARALAGLGQRIMAEYGAPQDIEWALAGGEFFILQSRPITSLFPVPYVSFDPIDVWFSFASVQGISGPVTVLGRDCIRWVFLNASRLFGAHPRYEDEGIIAESGERVWIRLSGMVRNPIGYRVMRFALEYIDPSIKQIIEHLSAQERMQAGKGHLRPRTLMQVMYFFLPVALRFIRSFAAPEWARSHFDAQVGEWLNRQKNSITGRLL